MIAEQRFHVPLALFHTDILSFWQGLNTILPWAGTTVCALKELGYFFVDTCLTANDPNPRSSIRSPREIAPLIASMTLSMQEAVSLKERPVVLLADRINEALFIIPFPPKSSKPQCSTGHKTLYRFWVKCSTGIAKAVFSLYRHSKSPFWAIFLLYRHSKCHFNALPA
jgi:hypothetical protein